MSDTPEAKAAGEIISNLVCDPGRECLVCANADGCKRRFGEIIASANADYYLPLLREVHNQLMEMKEAGYHGPELYDALEHLDAEIARLESAAKGGK